MSQMFEMLQVSITTERYLATSRPLWWDINSCTEKLILVRYRCLQKQIDCSLWWDIDVCKNKIDRSPMWALMLKPCMRLHFNAFQPWVENLFWDTLVEIQISETFCERLNWVVKWFLKKALVRSKYQTNCEGGYSCFCKLAF